MTERHKGSDIVTAAAYKLRPATADDAPAIKALIRAVHINPIGLKWTRFLVAVTPEEKLIGCGQMKPHWDGSRELASIAVKKGWRHQGIASAIIETLLAKHPAPVWLTCVNRLIPFYQQFGFSEVTRFRDMPPYFRLAKAAFGLYRIVKRMDAYLAVMATVSH